MPEFNQKKALEVLTPPVQELQNNKGEQVTNNSTQDEQEDEKKSATLPQN